MFPISKSCRRHKNSKYTELRNEILKLLIYIENEKVKRHVLHSIVEAFVDSRLY